MTSMFEVPWRGQALPSWPSEAPAAVPPRSLRASYDEALSTYLTRGPTPVRAPTVAAGEAYFAQPSGADAETVGRMLMVLGFTQNEVQAVIEAAVDALASQHDLPLLTRACLLAVGFTEDLHKIHRSRPSPSLDWEDHLLFRLRGHLAATTKDDRQLAEREAESVRAQTLSRVRCASCALFPERQDWAEAERREGHEYLRWVLTAVEEPALAVHMISRIQLAALGSRPELVLATIHERAGGALVEGLRQSFAKRPLARMSVEPQRRAAELLYARGDARALACLADFAAVSAPFAEAALDLVHAQPDLAHALETNDGPLFHISRRPSELASTESLPSELQRPPWKQKKISAPKAMLTPELPAPRLVWGREYREWLREKHHLDLIWPRVAEAGRRGDSRSLETYLAFGPDEELARSLIPQYQPKTPEFFPRSAARFGLLLLPVARSVAQAKPGLWLPYLAPFGDAALALPMAKALTRPDAKRLYAQAWFRRHPEHAAAGLVAPLWGASKKDRDLALTSARYLSGLGHRARLLAALEAAGGEGAKLDEWLDQPWPARAPKLPESLRVEALAPLRLADGSVLPPEAIRIVLQLLSVSTPEVPHPLLRTIREVTPTESRASFAWSLFELREFLGAPTGMKWAMWSLAWLGGGADRSRLADRLKSYAKRQAWAQVDLALETLERDETVASLRRIRQLQHEAEDPALSKRVAERLATLAEARGQSLFELQDGLVSDLGLEQDGARNIDCGDGRAVCVSLTARLELELLFEGERLDTWPQLGPSPEAQRAQHTWEALVAEHAALMEAERRRWEAALVERRVWSVEGFTAQVLEHPVQLRFAQNLLWSHRSPRGKRTAFRVAEGHLLDAIGARWSLPVEGELRLLHPFELGPEENLRWRSLWADHALVPPFEQLDRRPARTEDGDAFGAFVGRTQSAEVWARLRAQGWRTELADAELEFEFLSRSSAQQVLVRLHLEPGSWAQPGPEVPHLLSDIDVLRPDPEGDDTVFLSECRQQLMDLGLK